MNQVNNADCIFCKIATRTLPAPLEYEDDYVAAFKDINPHAPVHLLIIPKKHIEKIGDLEGEDVNLLSMMAAAAKSLALKFGIYEEGYRLVINSGDNGGQTVYHLHMHMLGGRFMRWPPG